VCIFQHYIMSTLSQFPSVILDRIRAAKIIGLRAGTGTHRFIGLWVVVAEGRVFVRSWGVMPGGWYDALRADRQGTVNLDGQEFAVRPVFTRSERIREAVDTAYAEKYHTPGAQRYVNDLRGAASRATTTELVPV
jgi:hypothetical protein